MYDADRPGGLVFDSVADLYDDIRPRYPDELYRLLAGAVGPLAGRRVVELAAGPGIATRQLVARGAVVVAVEPGANLARRLRHALPEVATVRAVAERLPLRNGVADLVAVATAFHWFDADVALAEVRRVLRPGGHLAVWWANHRHGDGIDWEDAQSAVYERWSVRRGSRSTGAGSVGPDEVAAHLRDGGWHIVLDTVVSWQRAASREDHLRVLRTHSDNLALGADLDEFLAEVGAALTPWPVVTERLKGPLVVARMS